MAAIFQKKSTITKTDTLVERGRAITELFTSAIINYEALNKDVATEIAVKEAQIQQAQIEKTTLEALVTSNSKVVGNLRKIFE